MNAPHTSPLCSFINWEAISIVHCGFLLGVMILGILQPLRLRNNACVGCSAIEERWQKMADCGQRLRVPSAMGPSKAQAHEDISPANFSIPLVDCSTT